MVSSVVYLSAHPSVNFINNRLRPPEEVIQLWTAHVAVHGDLGLDGRQLEELGEVEQNWT